MFILVTIPLHQFDPEQAAKDEADRQYMCAVARQQANPEGLEVCFHENNSERH